jgi:periplasmic protein TonB
MTRESASWLGSLAVHGTALAVVSVMASLVDPLDLKFQRGRTVVQLQASIAAAPRETSEVPPTKVVAPVPKSAPPPVARPPETELARRPIAVPIEKRDVPDPPPVDPPPPDAGRPVERSEVNEPPEEIAAAPPPRPRAVEPKPATIDATVVSAAQLSAQGSQGSEYDELPKPYPQNLRPPYPADAHARRLTGSVVIRLSITADGRVDDVQVAESSGVSGFDESAVRTARNWRFQPARRAGAGTAIVLDMRVNFGFNT